MIYDRKILKWQYELNRCSRNSFCLAIMSIVLRRNGKLTLTYVFQKKIIGLVGF